MQTTARLFKSLSDETRLRILALLTQGERCVCELMAALELPQSTVSRHLANLRNSGLVDGHRQGVWMYYRLAAAQDRLLGQLLPLLQGHLVALPEAALDLASLQSYLQQKGEALCG